MSDKINATELLNKYKAKVGDEEFANKNKEFESELRSFSENVSADDLQVYLVKRWSAYLAKAVMASRNLKTAKADMIVFNISGTDFGAHRQYDKAIELYEKDPDEAIRVGAVDNIGTPLYMKGFNKGKPIDLKSITYQGFGAFRIDGEDKYVKGQITISSSLIDKVPTWQLIKNTEVGIKKSDDAEFLNLTTTRLTNFSSVVDIQPSDLEELFTTYMPKTLVDVQGAKNVADEIYEMKQQGIQRNFNDFYVVRGQLAGDGVFLTKEETKVDIMNLTDVFDFDAAEDMPIMTVFLPKENKFLPRRIRDGAVDIFVVGVPGKKVDADQPDSYSMMAAGVYVQPQYLESESEEIKPQGDSSFE